MKFVHKLITVCLLFVVSSQAMDMKKLSIVSKCKPQFFDKKHSNSMNGIISKNKIKELHTSSSNISFEKSTKNNAFDFTKKEKFISVLAKKYMNDKKSIIKGEDGKYYFDESEIQLQKNGLGGAWIGFWGGKAIVHGVWQGVLFGIQVGGDIVCPGVGTVTSATLNCVVTPFVIEPLSNVVAIGGSIAVGTATGAI
jgi:hypothetical protein